MNGYSVRIYGYIFQIDTHDMIFQVIFGITDPNGSYVHVSHTNVIPINDFQTIKYILNITSPYHKQLL